MLARYCPNEIVKGKQLRNITLERDSLELAEEYRGVMQIVNTRKQYRNDRYLPLDRCGNDSSDLSIFPRSQPMGTDTNGKRLNFTRAFFHRELPRHSWLKIPPIQPRQNTAILQPTCQPFDAFPVLCVVTHEHIVITQGQLGFYFDACQFKSPFLFCGSVDGGRIGLLSIESHWVDERDPSVARRT